ncbi:MAG: CSLREA domain-containing protein, partial [Bacteroidetes bacterium]|nr:CSLREA domain-containing protein [Bacteroidota bacterium]
SLINSCSADAAYTNVNATADQSKGSCWGAGPNCNVWFKFTATTAAYVNIQLKIGGSEGTLQYPYIALWNSSLSQLSCATYSTATGDIETRYVGLTPGATYYISIDTYLSFYAGSFKLCLTDVKDYDYYNYATDITSIINSCSADAAYSTAFATPDQSKGSCWATGPWFNRWFKFTATATTYINVQLKTGGSEGSIQYPYLALWNSSLIQLACASYSSVTSDIDLSYTGLTPGATYYISVDNYANTLYQGTFKLCLRDVNLPTIQFNQTSSSGSEASTPATIQINLSAVSASNVTVNYTVTGTATGGGTDYTLASGTYTITAGSTTANLSAAIVNDAVAESSETIIVTLSAPVNAVLGANTAHTYTILDNDIAVPTIQLDLTSSSGLEGTTSAGFLVDLSRLSSSDVTVNYTITGTASGAGVDYTLANGTLTISAGNTNGTLTAIVIDDATVEGSETIIVTLSGPVNATLGTNTVHTYTILNDDDSTPYTVNSANDVDDGTCDGTHCSLREAINAANLNAGFDVINFNLGAAGPYTINLGSALPALTDNSGLMINGFSNTGASANTTSIFNASTTTPMNAVYKVILNNTPGTIQKGLIISGNNNIIKGLVLPNFGAATNTNADVGIYITGTNNYILGCYIGMNSDGTTIGSTNYSTWVGIYSSAASNIIGDGTAAGANLIAGGAYTGINIQSPATGNFVRGNMIGLQKDGSQAIINTTYGIDLYASSNTIGGPISGQGNVISGCGANGITIHGTLNNIAGNIIGLQADGISRTCQSFSHQSWGIYMELASNNTIGGTNAGCRNIISDNSNGGINMFGNSNANTIINNYIGPNVLGEQIPGATQTYGIYCITQNNLFGGYTNVNAPNLIAYNSYGINMLFNATTGNLISRNKFVGNSTKPIHLWLSFAGFEANGNKPLPTITSLTATTVGGSNAQTGGVGDSVEVFKSTTGTCGNANTYLGTVKADAAGNWSLSGISVSTGETVMATSRTVANNNTSEFSICPAPLIGKKGSSDDITLSYKEPVSVLAPCPGGLPVELVSFYAVPVNDEYVQLAWVTATETNNDFFTVERSANAVNFEPITEVPGAGNSTSVLVYAAKDEQPLGGVSYYKLKQTDFDGKYKYSPIIAVNIGQPSIARVFPNPTTGVFTLQFSGNKENNVLVVMLDIMGREVFSSNIIFEDGSVRVIVNPEIDLPAGIYYVVASSNDKIVKHKLVITR